jgi:hypothetical protein
MESKGDIYAKGPIGIQATKKAIAMQKSVETEGEKGQDIKYRNGPLDTRYVS